MDRTTDAEMRRGLCNAHITMRAQLISQKNNDKIVFFSKLLWEKRSSKLIAYTHRKLDKKKRGSFYFFCKMWMACMLIYWRRNSCFRMILMDILTRTTRQLKGYMVDVTQE